MDVSKEELKVDAEGNAVYTIQIKDFQKKMKTWEPAKKIESKHFKFQEVELYLRVYPNGNAKENARYVSVYLMNATKKQVSATLKFKIGRIEDHRSNGILDPENGLGCSRLASLYFRRGVACTSSDEELKVICTIMKLQCLETEVYFDESRENINENKKRLVETNARIDGNKKKLEEARLNYNETKMKLHKTEMKLDETVAKFAQLEARVDDEAKIMQDETVVRFAQLEAKVKELDKGLMKLDETVAKFAQLEAKVDDEAKIIQDETEARFAQLDAKVKELDKGSTLQNLSCPACFVVMSSHTKIAQCIFGHFLCWSCKEKMKDSDCSSCGQPVCGRAFGMETYLKCLFKE